MTRWKLLSISLTASVCLFAALLPYTADADDKATHARAQSLTDFSLSEEQPQESEPMQDEKPFDEDLQDEEPFDEEPADAEPIDAEPADAEPIDEDLQDAEPIDEEPADESGTALDEDADAALREQIRTTYQTAKKKAKIKSFKGKCGRYVNQQLVILKINKKYIGCNGNREFDMYRKKKKSSGGYTIHAFGAKTYSLQDALEVIENMDPHARNILIGFEKGTSKSGRKYGHTLLIHGIENGSVYFSDSFAQTVDETRYQEGEPIVCTIERFAELYQKYRLDGVIWFESSSQ